MTKKEQIYIDYLIAKLLGKKIQSVADDHGCTRDWVYQKVREIEKEIDDVLPFRYETLRKYLDKKTFTKRDKYIQVALIRDMFKNGFSMGEISKFVGKPLQNIRIIICG